MTDITLTPDQIKARDEILAAQRSGGFHLLTGNAGSGKTTLMRTIAEAASKKRHRSVVLTAPTHKAVDVLRRRMRGTGIACQTLHSLLQLKPKVVADRQVFERDRNANPVMADFVVIDECSMVGEDLLGFVQMYLPNSFVLYVGDPAQLPPVGEKASATFETSARSHLSTIVRQAEGNPILSAALKIRDSQHSKTADWSWAVSSHNAPFGVFRPSDPDAWIRKAFLSTDFAEDPDSFRYLAWTNDRVAEINNRVRVWRYGEVAKKDPFLPGEMALFRAPLVQYGDVVCATNQEARVVDIEPDTYEFDVPSADNVEGWVAKLPSWRMTFDVTNDNGDNIVGHMPADDRLHNAIIARITSEARQDRSRWHTLHEFRTSMVKAQAVYALTVHNSQGSTFRTAFVDVNNISRRGPSNLLEMQQLLYVAATRPTHSLVLV